MYLGKDTTLKTLETMCNERAWLKKNVGKSFAKGRNMQHPTMLAVVGQRCWVHLHGAKAAVNIGIRYVAKLIVINLPYH